jgi:hypothetical protein
MNTHHERCWRDVHRQTEAPLPGSEAQSWNANPIGNSEQEFNMSHLPTILDW